MEKLILLLLVLAGSAIANWFKKLGPANRTEDDSTAQRPGNTPANRTVPRSPTVPRRPPAVPTSWEEELRRLLEGESPVPQAPVRPPPVVPVPPPAAPPPVMRPRPISARTIVSPASVLSRMDAPPGDLAKLGESSASYARASSLDVTVARHIRDVTTQRVQLTSVVSRQAPPELAEAVSLFRTPNSARQAVIASIILGPPRALEDFTA